MFKKVLVALDGTKPSERVVEHLRKFNRSIDIDLRLAHVASGRLRDVHAARDYVDGVARPLLSHFPLVDTVVLRGRSAGRLISHAVLEGFDLIAMTTKARHLLHGSVAESLLQHSPVPLFLVRAGSAPARVRTIVVPLDGSLRSASVLPLVCDFGQTTGAKAILVHVQREAGRGPEIATHLEDAVDFLRSCEVDARLVVRRGDPVEEILAAVGGASGTLIALATHGRSGEERRRFGSVAAELLRRCACPLLVKRTVESRRHQPLVILRDGAISRLAGP